MQLDSITAVERSHRIVLGSRVGEYPRETVSRLLGEGRIFEFWAHQACLIPVEDWPLYRLWMTKDHPWSTATPVRRVLLSPFDNVLWDRALLVKAFHLEPGVRRSAALDVALERALDRLRRTIGLERVVR